MLIDQYCVFCDLRVPGGPICSACLADLPRLENPCLCCAIELPVTSKYQYCRACLAKAPQFKRTYAAFSYLFPINLLMPKIKQEQQHFHLQWLAQALFQHLRHQEHFLRPQALVPVPISKLKKIRRGYNQTEQLALQLGKLLDLKCDSQLVLKIRDTRPQAELNARTRKTNLKAAFSARENHYQHVAIIDDVMTTGSTANEIAKTLRASGIQQVDVWVLARTPALNKL